MKKLFVIALAAVGMVACVNDEIIETPQGNAISFDNAFIDNATRAELDATTLDAFKVWGYIDAENGQVAPLFEGTEVSKATGDWTYSGGARYWAPGMQHYFQAIAPLTAAVAAEHANGEVSAINYTVDGDSDLIYAAYDKVGAAAGSTNGPVSFTFGHLLSKVEFEFVNGFAAEDGVTIAVKNVKMTVPASGKYTIDTNDVTKGEWTVDATTGTTLAFAGTGLEFGDKFVLPYDNSYAYAIEFDVDVTYGNVLINKDVHKTSSVMVALNKGTAYKFTATINAETLNMESIDFEVGEVGGWITGDDSTLGTAYISTAAALQAALNNPGVDTIVLTEDVTLPQNEALNVNAVSRTRAAVEPVAVTLDLNGYTITGDVVFGNAVIRVWDGAALIVKNGTIKSVAVNGGSAITNTGLLTLCNDVTIVGAQNGNDGSNYASYAVNTSGADSKLVVNGANISGRGAIGATNGAQVELNGGSYHTPYAHYGHVVYANGAGVEVVINDGTFTEGYDYANDLWGMYQIYSGNGARVIVRGGDFSQTWDCANGYDLCTGNNGVIEISGGIFADDPSKQNGNDYVAEGYTVIQNAEGKYVVTTSKNLIDQLVSGEMTNVVVSKPIVIAEGETVELNLEGKTISGALHKSVGAVLKNEGTLTITGGTISSLAKNGGSAIANYGNLTVENVVINGAEREGDGWPAYPINNYGDATLTNAVISGHQGCVALNAAGTTVLNNCDATKNYMKTSSHVFYVDHADAKVIVNGGTYNHNGFDGSLAYVNAGEVTINGGTFSSKDGGYGFAVLSAGKVTINDGNINAGLLGWGGKFVVNGGVYTSEPNANYLAEGLKAINKDGKYYVVAEEVELVASETELQDALAAGSSILLYEDINVTKLDLTALTNDVVIDANGKTITTQSNYGVQVKAGKNITLKNAKVEMTVEGNYITYAAGFKVENGDYQGNTITLKDCEIRMCNTDWAYAVNLPASVKNLNLVIDGCTLEGAIALQCWGDNNTITVTNSDLICNYTTNAMYTSYCVALQGDGTNMAENNNLNISGCTFSYSGVDNFNSEIGSVVDRSGENTNNTINVADCTYNNGVKAY